MTYEHTELVAAAARWLHTQGYYVIIAEMDSGAGEAPDAIGWKGTTTTLIECKTTRSDYFKDRKKWFRQHEADGMGDQRYYLTPPGLRRWRFAPVGDPLFQGGTGDYYREVMARKRAALAPGEAARISKEIGWDR